MELFMKLNEETNLTIVQVTHEEAIAEYGKRIIRLVDGEINRIDINWLEEKMYENVKFEDLFKSKRVAVVLYFSLERRYMHMMQYHHQICRDLNMKSYKPLKGDQNNGWFKELDPDWRIYKH